MKTNAEIIQELENRIQNEKENMKDSKSAGINSPGFNQDLGAHDALKNLLDWINEN